MKQVHNIRVRVAADDPQLAGALSNQLLKDAGIEHKDAKLSITGDDRYTAELWLDHQQPVRKLLATITRGLPEQQKEEVAQNPLNYLDTRTHCFLRLDKEQLAEGKYSLAKSADCVQVRLNIAAFPATKDNAAKIVKEIFNNHN